MIPKLYTIIHIINNKTRIYNSMTNIPLAHIIITINLLNQMYITNISVLSIKNLEYNNYNMTNSILVFNDNLKYKQLTYANNHNIIRIKIYHHYWY